MSKFVDNADFDDASLARAYLVESLRSVRKRFVWAVIEGMRLTLGRLIPRTIEEGCG